MTGNYFVATTHSVVSSEERYPPVRQILGPMRPPFGGQ